MNNNFDTQLEEEEELVIMSMDAKALYVALIKNREIGCLLLVHVPIFLHNIYFMLNVKYTKYFNFVLGIQSSLVLNFEIFKVNF